MEISQKEKMLLQRIMTNDTLDIMKRIAYTMIAQWNQNPIDQDTSFLTAKEAIKREERKKSLLLFLETIEQLSYDKN